MRSCKQKRGLSPVAGTLRKELETAECQPWCSSRYTSVTNRATSTTPTVENCDRHRSSAHHGGASMSMRRDHDVRKRPIL